MPEVGRELVKELLRYFITKSTGGGGGN